MADSAKQKYYQDNKDVRLAYQRSYYKNNKDLIKRRLELRKEGDPEWDEKRKEYNRNYYRKNKERIRKKRSLLHKKRSKNDAEKG
tara:strand:- start:335 stop:589 length:255 start_codon:yes stop_codon:yes gene_type:complete